MADSRDTAGGNGKGGSGSRGGGTGGDGEGNGDGASGTGSGSDETFADIVSFADKARERGRPVAERPHPSEAPAPQNGDSSEIARGAMRHRLAKLRAPSRGYRSIDDELAPLVFDSGDADDLPAASEVRSIAQTTRELTFEGPDLLLEVQIEGRNREMTCQVVPPMPSTLEVRHANGSIDLGRDEFGTFYSPQLPPGEVSLRCVPLNGRAGPTATSWVHL